MLDVVLLFSSLSEGGSYPESLECCALATDWLLRSPGSTTRPGQRSVLAPVPLALRRALDQVAPLSGQVPHCIRVVPFFDGCDGDSPNPFQINKQ